MFFCLACLKSWVLVPESPQTSKQTNNPPPAFSLMSVPLSACVKPGFLPPVPRPSPSFENVLSVSLSLDSHSHLYLEFPSDSHPHLVASSVRHQNSPISLCLWPERLLQVKNFARFLFLSEARGRWWPRIVFRTSLSHALAALTPATSSFILHHLCIALPCGPFLLPRVFKGLCHRVLSLHLPLKLHPSALLPHYSYLNLSCSVSGGCGLSVL